MYHYSPIGLQKIPPEGFFKLIYMLFFISNTFISNARLKMAKNQANAKQHPEAELLLFENLLHSSSTLPSKINGTYTKN